MSILIKDMEIPRTCYYCRFQGLKSISLGDNRIVYFHSCSLLCKNVDDYENNCREDCPLIEFPDTYEIKTRSLTDEERKSYLEALKKGAVKIGNRLYLTDEGGE